MKVLGWPPRYVGLPGQGPPRKFSAMSWLRGLGGFAEQFAKEVPGEFWAEDVANGEGRLAIISCQCGKEPKIPENRIIFCECDRAFLFLGDRVRVAKL